MKKCRNKKNLLIITIIALTLLFIYFVLNHRSFQNTINAIKLNIYLNNHITLEYKKYGDKISVRYDSKNRELIIRTEYQYNMYEAKLETEKYISENNIKLESGEKIKIECTWENFQEHIIDFTFLEYNNGTFNTLISSNFTQDALGNFDFGTIEYFLLEEIKNDIDFSRFTNLRILDLSSNRISETYLSALKKVLPKDCKIVGYILDDEN